MKKCINCGKELNDNSQFCDSCGQNQNLINQSSKPVKKKRGGGCLITLVAGIVIFISVVILIPASIGANKNSQTSSNTSIQTESHDETTPSYTEEEYKGMCQSISYEDIARDTNGLCGEYFTFTGEVIQVSDNMYRMNVTVDDYGYYTDTILFSFNVTDERILEDDIITIWGQSKGLTTYKTVLGAEVTIPEIEAKYVEIIN